MLGRKYHLFGQGLIGAGIAMLYFSVFASANFYHQINIPTAFALMVAGHLHRRLDRRPLRFAAGGRAGHPRRLRHADHATTGVVNYVGLYSYLLVLGIGVFGISYWKNWQLLNYLSFLGTYGLLFGQHGIHGTTGGKASGR